MLLPTTLDSLAPTSRQVGSETGLGAPRQVWPNSDTAIVGGSATPWGGHLSATAYSRCTDLTLHSHVSFQSSPLEDPVSSRQLTCAQKRRRSEEHTSELQSPG